MDRRAANLTRGALSFSPNESGLDFASFLLGYPTRSQTAEGYPSVNMRSRRVGAYVTDEWRVARNLSITAGLRFDYMGNPYDLLGHVRSDRASSAPIPRRGVKSRRSFQPSLDPKKPARSSGSRWPHFWQPRLGVAYRPTPNG